MSKKIKIKWNTYFSIKLFGILKRRCVRLRIMIPLNKTLETEICDLLAISWQWDRRIDDIGGSIVEKSRRLASVCGLFMLSIVTCVPDSLFFFIAIAVEIRCSSFYLKF